MRVITLVRRRRYQPRKSNRVTVKLMRDKLGIKHGRHERAICPYCGVAKACHRGPCGLGF